MKTKFFGCRLCATSSSATVYTSVYGAAYTSTAEYSNVFPCAGTFRKLYVLLTSDPDSAASAKGYRFTLRFATANGALGDSALTVDVLSSTTSFRNSDVTHEVTVAAGDKVDLSIAPIGGPANSPDFTFVMEFEGTTAGDSVLLGKQQGGTLGTATTVYQCVGGQANADATTEANTYTVMPCAGSITTMYVRLSTSPGAGKTRTFNIRVNGADVGTAVAFTAENGIKYAAQSGVNIVAGDRINISCISTGGTPASATCSVGIVFQPTTAGEFVIPYASPEGALSGTALRYFSMAAGGTTPVTGHTLYNILQDDFIIKQAYGYMTVDPGASPQKYTFTMFKDGSVCATPYEIVFDGVQGPLFSSAADYTPVNWSTYDTCSTPGDTPTASRIVMSYLGYIAPAAGGLSIPVAMHHHSMMSITP